MLQHFLEINHVLIFTTWKQGYRIVGLFHLANVSFENELKERNFLKWVWPTVGADKAKTQKVNFLLKNKHSFSHTKYTRYNDNCASCSRNQRPCLPYKEYEYN